LTLISKILFGLGLRLINIFMVSFGPYLPNCQVSDLNNVRAIKKSGRKTHLSWMMLRKQGALNDQMLRLGCCLPPLSKFLATCLGTFKVCNGRGKYICKLFISIFLYLCQLILFSKVIICLLLNILTLRQNRNVPLYCSSKNFKVLLKIQWICYFTQPFC